MLHLIHFLIKKYAERKQKTVKSNTVVRVLVSRHVLITG